MTGTFNNGMTLEELLATGKQPSLAPKVKPKQWTPDDVRQLRERLSMDEAEFAQWIVGWRGRSRAYRTKEWESGVREMRHTTRRILDLLEHAVDMEERQAALEAQVKRLQARLEAQKKAPA